MFKKTALIFCVLLLASAAGAQDYKIEVSGYGGWTFSDGIPIDTIEFALDQQRSALEASGRGSKREFTDMNVNNYHVNLVYNWGDDRDVMRPFIFGGVGATQYSPSDVMGNVVEGGQHHDCGGA